MVDKQSQPGQAKEDPRGHEDTVPLWIDLLRVAVCTQHMGSKVRMGKTALVGSALDRNNLSGFKIDCHFLTSTVFKTFTIIR